MVTANTKKRDHGASSLAAGSPTTSQDCPLATHHPAYHLVLLSLDFRLLMLKQKQKPALILEDITAYSGAILNERRFRLPQIPCPSVEETLWSFQEKGAQGKFEMH